MNDKRGFTLIELLVVIAIIAVIAGLVLLRVGSAIADARAARTKADLMEIVNVINIAKQKTGKTLWQITKAHADGIGNTTYVPVDNKRECTITIRGAGFKINNLPDSDQCIQDMKLTWDAIYNAAGVGITGSPPKDAWGSPYLLDANENESSWDGGGFCLLTPPYAGTNSDSVRSAGPDQMCQNSDDIAAERSPDKIVCP